LPYFYFINYPQVSVVDVPHTFVGVLVPQLNSDTTPVPIDFINCTPNPICGKFAIINIQ
jgi:hypothetical protein